MASASNGTNNITYTYDANGLRHTKTVDGVVYTYYYAGDKLVRETFGSTVIDFFYDPDGRPYAMKYNSMILYYVLNQQGDVVRLIDSEGVNYGTYKYDAWGNILQMPSTNYIKNNPLRYRGYVYDPETELYYCQSRYYDPKIGRFINADALVSTGQGIIGNNMYTYCLNNPVSGCDPCGTFPIGALIGAAVLGAVIGAISAWVTGGTEKDITNSALGGAIESTIIAVAPESAILFAGYHFIEIMTECGMTGMDPMWSYTLALIAGLATFGFPSTGDEFADIMVDATFGLGETLVAEGIITGAQNTSRNNNPNAGTYRGFYMPYAPGRGRTGVNFLSNTCNILN